MEIRRINDQINWKELIGIELETSTSKIVCSNHENDKLYIQEWPLGQLTGVTSVIPTLNTEQCLAHLAIFGYVITLIDGFGYSQETIQKAQGLIQAGFVKLIKLENNYMVDNIFQQTFLPESELQFLLDNNVLEINLSEIK